MNLSLTLSRRALLGAVSLAAFAPGQLWAEGGNALRLRCRFADQDFTYALIDNPTTRDLLSILPLDLTVEDFSTNEKLAHLPRRLDEGGLADYADEAPGDLCYFRGWGNLAFFHAPYTYRGNLIRLGRIEGPVTPLRQRGTFPLSLDLI